MGWFKRFRERMRNYSAGSDYAGGHGDGQSAGSKERNAKAQFETTVNRPDRFGGGGWGG